MLNFGRGDFALWPEHWYEWPIFIPILILLCAIGLATWLWGTMANS